MTNNSSQSDNQPMPQSRDWLDPVLLGDYVAGKTILVGITGGIAAYKSCTIVSRLAQAGADVHVAMTLAATEFITPMTFEALSGNPVYDSIFDQVESSSPGHISLADRCDAAVIAPCTMNTLANLVHGNTNDAVSLIVNAIDRKKVPVLFAPSMNDTMWHQPSTQRNIDQANADGLIQIGPGSGWQACRHSGSGRMSEPGDICRAICEAL